MREKWKISIHASTSPPASPHGQHRVPRIRLRRRRAIQRNFPHRRKHPSWKRNNDVPPNMWLPPCTLWLSSRRRQWSSTVRCSRVPSYECNRQLRGRFCEWGKGREWHGDVLSFTEWGTANVELYGRVEEGFNGWTWGCDTGG